MKDLIFQVSVGKPSRLYSWCQDTIKDYAERIGADYHLLTEPLLKIRPDPRRSGRSREATEKYGGYLPIMEKLNAWDLLQSPYGRIAVIDADVWIRESAPSIFEELGDADIAAMRERDTFSLSRHRRKLKMFSHRMFGPLKDVDWDWDVNGVADFHNMGVAVIGNGFKEHLHGQSAREFLERPELQRFINGEGFLKWSTEQTMTNWWIRRTGMKVKNLNWKWNCLYGAAVPEAVKEAWFVHFFLKDKLPGKGENVEALEREIT